MTEEKKYSVADFATKIRDKYNAYEDVDDSTLVSKFVDKYPVYKDRVDMGSESSEPLEQSEGITTTSSSETQSPTQEESGSKLEPIDIRSYTNPNAPIKDISTHKESVIDENINQYNKELVATEETRSQIQGELDAFDENLTLLDEERKTLESIEPQTREEELNKNIAVDNFNNKVKGLSEKRKQLTDNYNTLSEDKYRLLQGESVYKQEKAIAEQEKNEEERLARKAFLDGLPTNIRLGMSLIGGAKMGYENIASSFLSGAATDDYGITQEDIDNASGSYKEFLQEKKEAIDKQSLEYFEKANELEGDAKETAKDYGLVTELGQMDFKSPMDYFNFAITSVAEQAPQIPLAVSTLGLSTFAQTQGSIMSAIINEKVNKYIDEGLDKDEAFRKAVNDPELNRAAVNGASVMVAGLDLIGAGKLMGSFGKKATAKFLTDQLKTSAAKKFATGVITEEATEIAQEYIEAGGREVGKGGDVIEGIGTGVKSIEAEDIANIAAKTFFGAGGFAALNAYTDNGTINKENVEMLINAAKDDKVFKNIEEQLALKRISGEITQDEYQQKVEQLSSDIELASKVDEDLSTEEKVKALDLVKEKYNLQQEIAGKEVVSPQKKQRLQELDEQIKNFGQDTEGQTEQPSDKGTDGREDSEQVQQEGVEPREETERRIQELEGILALDAKSVADGNGGILNDRDAVINELSDLKQKLVSISGNKPNQAALKVSSDTKTALTNKKKKQEILLDENGIEIVNETEITKEDASVELDRLGLLAERGKLTFSEFMKSYFAQSTDSSTLSEVKTQIKDNPVEFINDLRNSFNELTKTKQDENIQQEQQKELQEDTKEGEGIQEVSEQEEKVNKDVDRIAKVSEQEKPKGKIRGFAESVISSDRLKNLKGLKDKIKNNPENYYEPQKWDEIKDKFESLTEDELVESMNEIGLSQVKDGNDNNSVLAAVELINRRLADGKPIDDIVEKMSVEGTRMGQLIAQFATLKNSTPAGIISTLEKYAEKDGKIFSKAQRKQMMDLASKMFKSTNKLNQFIKDKGGKATNEDIKTLKDLESRAKEDARNFYKKAAFALPLSWNEMLKMTVQGNLLTPMSQATNIVANVFQQALMLPVDFVKNSVDLVQSVFTGKRVGSLDPMKYVAGYFGVVKGLKETWDTITSGDSSYAKGEIKKSFKPINAFSQALSETKLGDLLSIESGLLPKTLSKKGKDLIKQSKKALLNGDVELANKLKNEAIEESGISTSDRMKKMYEAFFGAAPEIMFRLLSLGDKPFYYFTQYKNLYIEGKRKGLRGNQLRNYVMLPDAKTLEDVNKDAAESVFMEDGLLSTTALKITNNLEKTLSRDVPIVGGGLSFLFRTSVPYVKTPSNIISQTIDFVVPPIALGKAIHSYKNNDIKNGNKNMGIFVTGMMLGQAAGILIAEGLISSPFDFGEDPEDENNIKRAVGFPPDHINLSGLKRYINGDSTELRDGDLTVNLRKFGILGGVILIRSSQRQELYREAKKNYGNPRNDSKLFNNLLESSKEYFDITAIPATAKYATEQSFLAGTASILEAVSGGEASTRRWIKQTLGATITLGVPNTLTAIDRATETYLHDMRSDNLNSLLESVIISKAMPVQKFLGKDIYEDIPIRMDIWGNKIKTTPEGKNPIFHHFFDVSKSQTVPHDKKSLEVYNIYRQTLNPKVVPNPPSRSLTDGGVNYKFWKDKEGNNVYEDYSRIVGSQRAKFVEKLLDKSYYRKADIDKKAEYIINAYKNADNSRETREAKENAIELLLKNSKKPSP